MSNDEVVPSTPERSLTSASVESASSTPPWVGEFLEVQSREIELRSEQTKLDRVKEDHSFEYAKASLDAQKNHLAEERYHRTQRFMFAAKIAAFVISAVLIFLATVILSGNGQIALELVKVLVYGGAGAAGGYGVAKSKKSEKEASSGE